MNSIIDDMMHIIEIKTKGEDVKDSEVYVKSSVFINKNVSKVSDTGIMITFKARIKLLNCPMIFNLISLKRNV